MKKLTGEQFMHMVDAACITATMSFSSQRDLVEKSLKYGYKQVYGFASYYDYLIENLKGTVTASAAASARRWARVPSVPRSRSSRPKPIWTSAATRSTMWMNIAALKNAEFDYVVKDIQAVRAAMKPGHNLKVIIEPATLTEEQIELAVQCVIDGGAGLVKAGTGFIGSCTLRHAELMLRAADGKVKVKCSGGIRDVETVKQMVDMGVARIGMGVGSSLNIYRALNAENE